MSNDQPASAARWAADWLSSVERLGGGLEAVKAIAEQKGVHLLLLEDDKGNELIAASTKPFKVVC